MGGGSTEVVEEMLASLGEAYAPYRIIVANNRDSTTEMISSLKNSLKSKNKLHDFFLSLGITNNEHRKNIVNLFNTKFNTSGYSDIDEKENIEEAGSTIVTTTNTQESSFELVKNHVPKQLNKQVRITDPSQINSIYCSDPLHPILKEIPVDASIANIIEMKVRNSVLMADWAASVAIKHRGNGSKMFSNGDSYSGDIVNDDTVGFGVMVYASGDVAKGQWIEGSVMSGYGSLSYFSSDKVRTKYVGEFQNDKRHGYGKTKKRGDTKEAYTYEGQYADDKRHGYGKLKYKDGDTFEGLYKEGRRDGKGTL